jgi:chemotaxis protein methyltransferase CheR
MKVESTLSDNEREAIQWIRSFLYDQYGIFFREEQLYSLKHRIRKRIRQTEAEDLESYAALLKSTPAEIPNLLEDISTNKTYFFRESRHWKFLNEELIPQWKKRDRVDVWSAACSSGEEPYTVALLLEEALGKPDVNFDYRILATDIAREVLGTGVRGEYTDEDVQAILDREPELLDRYFDETEKGWRVSKSIRRNVVFREHNLNSDRKPFRDTFQLVIARNVFIYFDEPVIERVVEQLTAALEPGGYLFIGHTETITDVDHDLQRIQPSVYRKQESDS